MVVVQGSTRYPFKERKCGESREASFKTEEDLLLFPLAWESSSMPWAGAFLFQSATVTQMAQPNMAQGNCKATWLRSWQAGRHLPREDMPFLPWDTLRPTRFRVPPSHIHNNREGESAHDSRLAETGHFLTARVSFHIVKKISRGCPGPQPAGSVKEKCPMA